MALEAHTGLTMAQVKANRDKYGKNILSVAKPNIFFEALKEIILQPMILLLTCAAIVYFFIGEPREAIIMLIAIGLVSGISIYQENKSRNAINALKKISSPKAKVIREGLTSVIPSDEIVIDDLIIVEDGNLVPADAGVIEVHDFTINESILTGESLAVSKTSLPPDNLIYQGTMVMTGSCIAKVVAIGSLTEFGKLGQSMAEIEVTKTPLQLQIQKFVSQMAWMGFGAFLIVWWVNYQLSKSILHGLMHGLTMAMSVLPEEIPVALSTFMALGAYQLYKSKVITRSPHTVESLGAATVICVDKTGTITENKMSLAGIYDFKTGEVYDYTSSNPSFNPVLEFAMWSSEVKPFDNMEKSIHSAYGSSAPLDKRAKYKLIHEYPLSGNPPVMTHVFSNEEGDKLIAVKGSAEGVIKQCKLSPSQINQINEKIKAFASKGYRVLGVGRAVTGVQKLPPSQHDFEFEFLGLISFYDPPKKNMKGILRKFYNAGLKVKIITGDYSETVRALARQIDFKNDADILTGSEVLEMDKPQLTDKVRKVNIYARMFPEAKLRVIEALKSNGEVVAMTGDGVNDGPALKAAHIGIAMGQSGSEIAKQAASLVLMDDDLDHMVEAIGLGRRIYENLKKAIQYIISIHIPIILIITIPLFFTWKFSDIFLPIHVIFLELIMGPTCSIVFAREPMELNSMNRSPRRMTTSFFSLHELMLSIIQGLIITLACLGLGYYFLSRGYEENEVRTVTYTCLIFSNIFLTLANRSFTYSILTTLRYKNKLLPGIIIASLLIFVLFIYFRPVRELFRFAELSLQNLFICMAVAFIGVMWIEVYKLIKRSIPG
jgi:Ca2+-transporting ATPase